MLKKIGKLHDFSAGLVIGGKVCDMSKIVFKSDINHQRDFFWQLFIFHALYKIKLDLCYYIKKTVKLTCMELNNQENFCYEEVFSFPALYLNTFMFLLLGASFTAWGFSSL